MIDLYELPLFVIFIIGFIMILAAVEIGWQLGLRTGSGTGGNIGALEGAIIGLLALIIGFTFAMALSRFEARRDAVVQEANAIGTAALRARMLPQPQRAETLKLFREYVQVRLDAYQNGRSFAAVTAAVNRSNELQELLWQQAMAVSAQDKGLIPTALFVQALNQMIDSQGLRLAALRNQIPNVVLVMLFVLAGVSSGFAGYASAVDGNRIRMPSYVLGLLVSTVLYLIVDLDRPNNGFITNSQQAMIDVAASLASFRD